MSLVARVAAVTLTCATLVACGPSADAEPGEPTKVLIYADSIAQGRAGDVTWRYHVWNAFRANIDLVGPKQGQAADGDAPDVMDYPHEFDYDHAARWGMSLTFPDWSITDQIQTYDPDVVIEQLGANDFLYDVQTPQTMIGGLRNFVAEARAAKPSIDIVLAQITWNWMPDGQEFNPLLPALAAELDTPESRVVVSVMPQMTSDDTYDGAHPDAEAEMMIADAHIDALLEVGVTKPRTPAPTPPPVQVIHTPVAPLDVTAVRKGQRVKVTWTPVVGATSYVARCGKVKASTPRLRVRLAATKPGSCRVRGVNEAGAGPWTRA